MKIAYITQAYPPIVSGASLFAGQLAEAMAERGHQVLVIAPSSTGRGAHTQLGNLLLVNLQSFHNPNRVRQRVMVYPRHAILETLHEFQPDIIHSHDCLQVGLIGIDYAHRAGIPITTTTHQLPWFIGKLLPDAGGIQRQAETLLWAYAHWVLRQHDAIVAPTDTISNVIKRMTGLSAQVISYGINLKTFHPPRGSSTGTAVRKKLGLSADVPVILHVGQMHTTKRVDVAIEAAVHVMHHSNAHLLLVGDGPQKPALMDRCHSLGLAERCHFTGFITVGEGLPDIYRLASLFITASEIETQGIVLLEAAASGLPIVAVRATCIPEIVHAGVNGYLADPGDTMALAEAITELLLDPVRARAMGVAGRQLVGSHDIHVTLDSYERLYLDLIRQSAVQRAPERSKVNQWQERAKEWLNL
jgi:glycosyltransferase involved in cell wall biosynthesis